jgi:hypothetical protein
MFNWLNRHRDFVLIIVLFAAFRLMMLVTFPADNLTLFGDYPYYYELATYSDQGYWPFIHYWSEYPPLFPFLSVGLYRLTRLFNGGYPAFVYLMGLVMTACSTGNLVLFLRLAQRLHDEQQVVRLGWVYSLLFVPLIFGWWNFDAITTLTCLLALELLLSGRELASAAVVGLGAMVKLVPLLVFPAVVRTRSWRRWLIYGLVIAAVIAVIAVPLLIAGGPMALASFASPGGWSSWETVWALIDGNLRTGLLGAPSEHFDVSKATTPVGNPARVPEWLRLVAFGLLYGWLFWKANGVEYNGVERGANGVVPNARESPRKLIAFIAMTFVVFFLWSKGWSPQWQTLLFPLLLLVLPLRRSVLFILVLSFVNLAEWPVFLSRGMNQYLYLTVPLRTILLILLLIELTRVVQARSDVQMESRV